MGGSSSKANDPGVDALQSSAFIIPPKEEPKKKKEEPKSEEPKKDKVGCLYANHEIILPRIGSLLDRLRDS